MKWYKIFEGIFLILWIVIGLFVLFNGDNIELVYLWAIMAGMIGILLMTEYFKEKDI